MSPKFLLSGHNILRQAAIAGVALFSFEILILLIAGWLDGNFILTGVDVGLLEHFGLYIILLGDLLLLMVIAALIKTVLRIERKFPLTHTKSSTDVLRRVKPLLIDVIMLKSKNVKVFYYAMGVATLLWLNNAYQTTNPLKYYGNDVADSINFIYTYAAVRFVLGTSWIFLYPYLMFVSIYCCLIIFKFLGNCKKKQRLNFDIHHFDKCGGFSYFGELNFYFVLGLLIIYVELIAVLLTHKQLNLGLATGFFISSVILIFGSYYFIYPVVRYLSEKRTFLIGMGYRKVIKKSEPYNLLEYKWLIENLTFSPYTAYQKNIINLARFSPVITFGFKLITP